MVLHRSRHAVGAALLAALSMLTPERSFAAPHGKSTKSAKPSKPAKKPGVHTSRPAPPPRLDEHDAPVALHLDVKRFTLGNGLRVVLNADRTSPTVAVVVTYDVGSRGEAKGQSGFAHLFEHMMFQGSRNVPKGDHFKLVSSHGGVLNGTTSTDRTNYFEVVPSSELPLALFLEADRMKSLAVTAENLENQRRVVKEEFRMRVSNAPYVPSQLRLEELAYQGYWPYEHPTIGSMADLDAAALSWVTDFHTRHYAPNNAVLTISGDFDAETATALVHRFFDDAVRADVAHFDDPPLPAQATQRTAVVKDDNIRTPGVMFGWVIPPYRAPDHYALEVASVILGDGESSRLHQRLVRDRAIAQNVNVGTDDRRGPDLFSIQTTLAAGATVGDAESEIEGALKSFAKTGPSSEEMTKARRRIEAGFVLGLQSNVSRARKLGEFETFFGDAALLERELARYVAVTPDDVRRVVAEHLGTTKRTVIETTPSVEPPPPPASPTTTAESKPKAGSSSAAPHGKHDAKAGSSKADKHAHKKSGARPTKASPKEPKK